MPRTYNSAAAFRQALDERLNRYAREHAIEINWLRRQVAFERFLARIFEDENTPMLLKGGYALELRLKQVGRTTLDVDLTVPDTRALRETADADYGENLADVTYDHLQERAGLNLNDYFTYTVRPPRILTTAPEGGVRCSVDCVVARQFSTFRVDVGLGDPVTGEAEWLVGQDFLGFAGIKPPRIPLLPAPQQLAEKIHAYSLPRENRANTRVKDFADIMLLLDQQPPEAGKVSAAVQATFSRRDTHPIPRELPEPPAIWAAEYAALADRFGLAEGTLDAALVSVNRWWRALNFPDAD